jgi:2-oxoglutarate ferredoxin oxidoreductase subunit alpha
MSTTTEDAAKFTREQFTIESATIRLAGDSGDGMQVSGTQLTNTSAMAGNDVATFPDYPSEIRAPRGTRAGVSGYQVQFASTDIFTPGDELDALVAMNPAALVTNVPDLRKGGILIVNSDNFDKRDLELAKLMANPLDDPVLSETYRLIKVPMTSITRKAVEDTGLNTKLQDRCKNFFAVGLLYFLYGRGLDPTLRFIADKFGKRPEIAHANEKALRAGWNYGETTEAFVSTFKVEPANLTPGKYKNLMGNTALAWGLLAAAKRSNIDMFYGSYPITPASGILEELADRKHFGVKTFQAEDEIAAICSSIGAAFAGVMAVTGSSGPGIALKGEAMGLAMILELPLIIINIQRGGPSTGLPTKTEQSDLLQALYGRNGECPIPVISCSSPADCFDVAQEAWRIAAEFMTPIVLLSDGYIANGAEPWRIPDVDALPQVKITYAEAKEGETFLPYKRNEKGARPWAIPGTEHLMHRIGGLERGNESGNVSYDPDNHQLMTNLRQQKLDGIVDHIPLQEVVGPEKGDLLLLSWGGTFGSCTTAVARCQSKGLSVAHAHLRYLNPFPKNLGDLLKNYKQVLIPELNMGQLRSVIRGQFLLEPLGLNKVKGRPFAVTEIVAKIEEILA